MEIIITNLEENQMIFIGVIPKLLQLTFLDSI